ETFTRAGGATRLGVASLTGRLLPRSEGYTDPAGLASLVLYRTLLRLSWRGGSNGETRTDNPQAFSCEQVVVGRSPRASLQACEGPCRYGEGSGNPQAR